MKNMKQPRQASLNSKEMFQVNKFKTDANIGPVVNQHTPGTLKKMAPSKAFTGSDTKAYKNVSPSNKQKSLRSRNAESGK